MSHVRLSLTLPSLLDSSSHYCLFTLLQPHPDCPAHDRSTMQTIDPDSPLLVAKSTLILGGLGSLTGLTIGAIRAQNPILLGMNMGLNGTVGGLAFFGELLVPIILGVKGNERMGIDGDRLRRVAVREYVVSPLLLVVVPWESYRLRREALGVESTVSGSDSGLVETTRGEGKTMSLIRNDRLLDSGLAGGLTGGGISTMFRESARDDLVRGNEQGSRWYVLQEGRRLSQRLSSLLH
jgi:hypothetical protein